MTNEKKKKYYMLEMFSYPSGSKLHLGHWYNYGLSDSFARFKRMQGFKVFQPMGFDAFGLPAENYAIKTGVHPKDSTEKNIATMETQLKAMHAMFDWRHEIKTCEPDYYKWTQWLFLQLYKKGLAYQKEAPVNFCGGCQTVIANEQVVDGKCERCGETVARRFMKQWFFRITDYAEELLDGLDGIDWPEKTKLMQRNWIGRSEGGEILFALADADGANAAAGGNAKAAVPNGGKTAARPDKNARAAHKRTAIRVFTTRADTLFGVTYVVLAPEHPLVGELTSPAQRAAVAAYVAETAKISDTDRLSSSKEKTGVFTGAYAVNPVNGGKIPVYIADYVLYTYGTGAVMAVPAHDGRDFAFAKKYNLPIKYVIKPSDIKSDADTVSDGAKDTADIVSAVTDPEKDGTCFEDDGVLYNSGEFSGLSSGDGRRAILDRLSESDAGETKINYRLRDWSVSRQRYWGAPIPIVYCPEHGAVPVPEKDLPVTLPYDVNFKPSGKSPLAEHEGFINTVCPICGKKARRDPDTLDTFVCSSWYFLRYPFAHKNDAPWDFKKVNDLLPVDKYVGGAEHACMHLLYARFITRALRDMGFVKFSEPFTSLIHQGVILGPDGNRMSKSHGNTVSPDEYIEKYGADVFRLYLGFGFSYTEGGPWNDDGIRSGARFLERVTRLAKKYKAFLPKDADGRVYPAETLPDGCAKDETVNFTLHNAIKAVAADYETFSFNTAIARMMELVNALYKYDEAAPDGRYAAHCISVLIKLLAPLAPDFCTKLWRSFGGKKLFDTPFPAYDENALTKSTVEYAVQVNSRIRCKINLKSGLTGGDAEKAALSDAAVLAALNGAPVKKTIVIPNRLINFIV
jgi:leucyl-tRNA synthetase